MGSVVLNLRQEADARDAIHHAVEAISAGKLVVLPTDTVYGIACSALNADAISRLVEMVEKPLKTPLSYCVKSEADALDYAPDISPLARRLARRAWPGPLTLVLPGPHPDSVIQRIPESARNLLQHEMGIGLRVPNHPVIEQVHRLTAGPLILARAAANGQPDCVTGEEVFQQIGEKVSLILNDGKCRFAQPSTIARITGNRLEIIRPGVLDEVSLKRMSQVNILLVCTGNTCRSPMAEGLLKKKLGNLKACPSDHLEENGFRVTSAGIAAMPGGGPADEAVEVMHVSGIEISDHRTQTLNDRLVNEADLILTMTNSHRQMVVSQWPTAGNRVHLLGRGQGDIFDPIGMPMEYYEACAQQIDHHLNWWLNEHSLFKSDQPKGNSG